jgi:signal transduction histidine kinase
VVGVQLAGEARNVADRLATALRSERDGLASSARQDVMREIRIGDLDKRISSFLASLQSGCPPCLDLLVVDRNERVIASNNPSLLGRPPPALPARDRSNPIAIDGPLALAPYDRPLLRFTVPIPDPDAPAQRLGSLIAFIDWERATDVTMRVQENLRLMDVESAVLVVDAAGVVIGGTPQPNGPWRIGDAVPLPARGDSTSAVAEASGVLFGSAILPDDLPPWTLVVAEPLAAALRPVHQMAARLAAVLGVTLVIALAAALVAARRVTRPLAELTEAAGEVGRGEGRRATVPIRTQDEIGTLATAFNRMASDLDRAEERLVEAAKFAFVGELAAGVAHEVRTPLGVLRSSAQLLARSLTPPDAETGELLQNLPDEVDRIERVVSGLLELGRPRAMRREPSRLAEILFRATDFVEAQARAKGVAIRRRPPADDPLVYCDPDLIYQVALNLLVNAVQVLASGEAIDIVVMPAENGSAAFEVRDDGPGIPEPLRQQIFQPFFTSREGGAGLGLTFVQRVVLEHRGRVSVASNGVRGAVFRVELPLAEASA